MKKQFKFPSVVLLGFLLLATSFFSCKTETDSTETDPTYYTVSFDSDGGTEVASQSVESGKTATKPSNPTKDGYTFTAWYKGETKYDFSTPVTSNITLTAQWSKNTVYYTITYKSDYGTIPDSLKNGVSLAENTILTGEQLPALSDDNAVFKGWYDGETKAVAGEYAVTKNVTLTALWTDEAMVSYASVFCTVPTSFTAKLNQTLTAENLASLDCPPYTFLGWFYAKDESGNGTGLQAQVGEKITADTTLCAKWQTATVSFETQFGEVSSITKYTGEKIAESEIATLSETGYTFGGWFKDLTQLTSDYTVTGNVTFTAKWSPRTDTAYTVEHYKENADDDDFTKVEGDTENLTGTTDSATSATSKSYDNFTAEPVTQGTIAADGSTVVKVYYKRNIVTMTCNLDGGTIGGKTGATFTGKYGSSYTLGTPAKTGYTFASWNPTLPETMQGGTFTATYTANTYTVTFKANGGNGMDTTQEISFETSAVLLKNTFTRDGYNFEGWNTNADGSGSTYADGESFTMNEARNVTLYAQWSAVNGITVTIAENSDIEVTRTLSNNIFTFTATEEYDSYRWFFDNAEISTAQTCTINISSLAKGNGTYTVALEAQKDGVWYSYFAQIRVTK